MGDKRRSLPVSAILGTNAVLGSLFLGSLRVTAQTTPTARDSLSEFVSSAPSGNLVVLEALAERATAGRKSDQVNKIVTTALTENAPIWVGDPSTGSSVPIPTNSTP